MVTIKLAILNREFYRQFRVKQPKSHAESAR